MRKGQVGEFFQFALLCQVNEFFHPVAVDEVPEVFIEMFIQHFRQNMRFGIQHG